LCGVVVFLLFLFSLLGVCFSAALRCFCFVCFAGWFCVICWFVCLPFGILVRCRMFCLWYEFMTWFVGYVVFGFISFVIVLVCILFWLI